MRTIRKELLYGSFVGDASAIMRFVLSDVPAYPHVHGEEFVHVHECVHENTSDPRTLTRKQTRTHTKILDPQMHTRGIHAYTDIPIYMHIHINTTQVTDLPFPSCSIPHFPSIPPLSLPFLPFSILSFLFPSPFPIYPFPFNLSHFSPTFSPYPLFLRFLPFSFPFPSISLFFQFP